MRSSSHFGSTSLKNKDVRDFLFRGLMFEAEAERFRRAGIQIGADSTEAEESLLKEALAPFSVARRNNALEMARLFAVLFCFENEIRDFIREALEEKEGHDWLEKLPPKIKEPLARHLAGTRHVTSDTLPRSLLRSGITSKTS